MMLPGPRCGREYNTSIVDACPRCPQPPEGGWPSMEEGELASEMSPLSVRIEGAGSTEGADATEAADEIALLRQQNQLLVQQLIWLRKIREWLVYIWLGVVLVPGLIGLLILVILASAIANITGGDG